MKVNSETLKTKTFWTGLAGILTAAAGFFTGTMAVPEAAQMAVLSLLGITYRDAMVTTKKENKNG